MLEKSKNVWDIKKGKFKKNKGLEKGQIGFHSQGLLRFCTKDVTKAR